MIFVKYKIDTYNKLNFLSVLFKRRMTKINFLQIILVLKRLLCQITLSGRYKIIQNYVSDILFILNFLYYMIFFLFI